MFKRQHDCGNCRHRLNQALCACSEGSAWEPIRSDFYWALRALWARLARDWAASAAWAVIGAVSAWFLCGVLLGALR